MTTETTQNDRPAAAQEPIETKAKRVRRNSRWNGLTRAQCELVEDWLFEENLTYAQTAERVKKEFGMEVSLWSVGRFYRYRAGIRQTIELFETQAAVNRLNRAPVKTEEMRAVAVKLLAKKAVRLATEKPEDTEGLMAVTKVLLQSETNDIRLRRVKMEERYYDFEANAACAKELEKVRSYVKTVGDNEYLNEKDKNELVRDLLFGRDKVSIREAEELESDEEDQDENASEAAEPSEHNEEVANGLKEIIEEQMSGDVEDTSDEDEPGDNSAAQSA